MSGSKKKEQAIHIVYVCRYKGDCVYVGEGIQNRHLHITSGISHVYQANAYHFSGRVVDVEIIATGLSKAESLELEAKTILELRPAWNKASKCEEIPARRVNDILRQVFGISGMDGKGKVIQVKAIRYLFKLLNGNYKTMVMSGQLESALGATSVLSRCTSGGYYLKVTEIFSVVKSGKGYDVALLDKWIPNSVEVQD
jgi:hypothetical protein